MGVLSGTGEATTLAAMSMISNSTSHSTHCLHIHLFLLITQLIGLLLQVPIGGNALNLGLNMSIQNTSYGDTPGLISFGASSPTLPVLSGSRLL